MIEENGRKARICPIETIAQEVWCLVLRQGSLFNVDFWPVPKLDWVVTDSHEERPCHPNRKMKSLKCRNCLSTVYLYCWLNFRERRENVKMNERVLGGEELVGASWRVLWEITRGWGEGRETSRRLYSAEELFCMFGSAKYWTDIKGTCIGPHATSERWLKEGTVLI